MDYFISIFLSYHIWSSTLREKNKVVLYVLHYNFFLFFIKKKILFNDWIQPNDFVSHMRSCTFLQKNKSI